MISTHLVCGGAGPTQAGALPRVGELFGVQPDGGLQWFRYDGSGQQSADGSNGWAGNSGKVIGSGWTSPKFVCGGGDGVLFSVRENANLLWHRYVGEGTADPTGATGWAPKSGNAIGRGWAGFLNLVCTPKAGTSPASTLYGVQPNGDLLWYRYVGDGTADPTGGTGWAPKSGNPIGRGWHGFKILAAASDVLFGVEQNGDLRWYRYQGNGTADVTGGTGWHPNSRNVIAKGWHRFERIVGCPDDRGGTGIALYAIEPSGKMFWYKYLGNGEPDATGTSGWHPRSGSQIGRGWFGPSVVQPVHRLSHTAAVNAVTFSPDGSSVATGADDRSARVFELAGGSQRSRLDHDGAVRTVVWVGNGPLVATGSADYSARLFDSVSGAQSARIEHGGVVNALAASPDGQLLASSGVDGVVRLTEVATGTVVRRLIHNAAVTAAAFGPDGTRLVTSADDDTARVFNTATGAELLTLPHSGEIRAISVSPAGNRLGSASADGIVRLFDTGSGSQVWRIVMPAPLNAVTISPDGALVAVGCDDGTARAIDAASGAQRHQFSHGAPVRAVLFAPGGALLATAGADRTVRLWVLATASQLASYPHDGPVTALAVDGTATLFATGSADSTVRIFRVPQ